jgi:hypothetical protein
MFYFVLIVAVIALFALWRVEVGECEDARFYAKCCRIERDEEIKLRRKAESDVEALIIERNSLERRCEGLQNTCDASASENANIYSEREKLRMCTVEYAFSEWERRESVDLPVSVLFERDGIVLIYEGGKIVGWYSSDTALVRFKRQKRKAKTPKQSAYEAPSAEAVIANVGGNEEGS